MDNNIKISVVMSTYNNEASIEKAILSIANQTFTEWELLIVDDASKDNTNKILKKLVDKYNINACYDPCSYPGIQCKYHITMILINNKNIDVY